MEVEFPKSTCQLCGSEYAGKGVLRHLKSCLAKQLKKNEALDIQAGDFIYLRVKDAGYGAYFLHLLVSDTLILEQLDSFLRNIWVECCGHLSAFSYERYGDELDMERTVKSVLAPKQSLVYQYDFGSTTELTIEHVGEFRGKMDMEDPIFIMCRNAAPLIPCDECGSKPAVKICTECMWSDEGWLCEDCVKDHECGEEMMLPVVNSPRVGVCAYSG